MKNHELQKLADQHLSGLVWDERCSRKVLRLIDEEERPVKKFSATLILITVILCISMTALAAGLLFSSRYEAGKLANAALHEQYGLTDDLLSLFRREVTEQGIGKAIVTYTAPAQDFPTAQMGVYTVQVDGGKAAASWSNDGKDTSGGLMAEAFGAEQLKLLSYDYANTMQLLCDAGLFTWHSPAATPNPRLQGEIIWTEEDQAAADQALEMVKQAEENRLAEISKAEAAGSMNAAEAADFAKKAIIQEYDLNAKQQRKLICEPDSTYAVFGDGQPMLHLLFWLWQNEDGTFTEKDGQYWVTINLRTGVIEDILYDAALAGNG